MRAASFKNRSLLTCVLVSRIKSPVTQGLLPHSESAAFEDPIKFWNLPLILCAYELCIIFHSSTIYLVVFLLEEKTVSVRSTKCV